MRASSKPGVLAKFKTGVLLSAIDGVVATLNWLVSFADKFSVGPGLELAGVNDGTPKIALKLSSGKGIDISDKSGTLEIGLSGDVGGGVKITGTDGSHADSVKELTIAAGDDTALEANVSANSSDPTKATITINLYYK